VVAWHEGELITAEATLKQFTHALKLRREGKVDEVAGAEAMVRLNGEHSVEELLKDLNAVVLSAVEGEVDGAREALVEELTELDALEGEHVRVGEVGEA
jgi:hypothetical protein